MRDEAEEVRLQAVYSLISMKSKSSIAAIKASKSTFNHRTNVQIDKRLEELYVDETPFAQSIQLFTDLEKKILKLEDVIIFQKARNDGHTNKNE